MIQPLPPRLPALPAGLTYLGLGRDVIGLPLDEPDERLHCWSDKVPAWNEYNPGANPDAHYAAPHDHPLVWANLPKPPAPRAGYRWEGCGFGYKSSDSVPRYIILHARESHWGPIYDNAPRGIQDHFYAVEVPLESPTDAPCETQEQPARYSFTREEAMECAWRFAVEQYGNSDSDAFFARYGVLVGFVRQLTGNQDDNK